ncbi:MAG: binding-protein-dependent transport system inner rane component [Paenibacillaceae bacterium]|nr:binding-protein-dependent transport system inner rane component [Paenibacillaceae bacterium]
MVYANRFFRNIIKYHTLYLMMLPAIALLIFDKYVPMFGVIVAFKNYAYAKGIFGSPWTGFDNFTFLFRTDEAISATINTVLYNLVFIVSGTLVSIFLAIALNEILNRRLAKIYQSSLLFPHFLSYVVVSYLVYAFLGGSGYINTNILGPMGIEPLSWYSSPRSWMFILPIVHLWKGVGYSMVVYLASLVSIDHEYYEAAVIDGATKWQQIKSITIPLMTPVIVILFILDIGKIFNADFGLFYQVPLNSGPLFSTTNVIDTFVYRSFMVNGNVGMSSAAGLYQSIVGLILVLTTNAIVRKINSDNALF